MFKVIINEESKKCISERIKNNCEGYNRYFSGFSYNTLVFYVSYDLTNDIQKYLINDVIQIINKYLVDEIIIHYFGGCNSLKNSIRIHFGTNTNTPYDHYGFIKHVVNKPIIINSKEYTFNYFLEVINTPKYKITTAYGYDSDIHNKDIETKITYYKTEITDSDKIKERTINKYNYLSLGNYYMTKKYNINNFLNCCIINHANIIENDNKTYIVIDVIDRSYSNVQQNINYAINNVQIINESVYEVILQITKILIEIVSKNINL